MLNWFRSASLSAMRSVCLWIGNIHAPYARKQIKSWHYRDAKEVLKPGAVILTRTYGEATNVFIPSHFTHGLMYLGNNVAVEAVGSGVRRTDLIDAMMTKDEVVILNPLFCGPIAMEKAAKWAAEQIGKPYDFEFSEGNKAFYCFELIFEAYRQAVDNMPFERRERLGKKTIVGDDFTNAKDKWQQVWKSNEE
jgi:uncharacterized protein YycO